MGSSGRTRSLDLGIGFAVGLGCGAAAMAVVLAPTAEVAERSPDPSEVAPVAEAVRPIAAATATPAIAPADRPEIAAGPPPPIPPVAPAAEVEPGVAEVGPPPTIPLPRMPGSTRLSDSARLDAESATWVLKRAFKIHAREHHVLAFYEKALVDAGLRVSREAPAGPGTTYLLGRSDRVAAQVGVRMRAGTLETRVWILWRERA